MTVSRAQAQKRVIKLRQLIEDYRYNYHVLNKSIMSEEAADSLKHELAELEETYPDLITADSPTQRVAGKALSGFRQIEHSARMLSLNDVFSREEIIAWQKRIIKLLNNPTELDYFTDIKMDGLACALVYDDGLLSYAVTRGDGQAGEDVTANVRTIDSVPLRLYSNHKYSHLISGRTEVRGEIIMYKSDFEELNKKRSAAGLTMFANPRNTAAGTIRQLDPSLVAARPLYFRAYDILRDNPKDINTHKDAYHALSLLGFLVNQEAKIVKNIEEIMEYIAKWQEKRLSLAFNTDGLVIKVNRRDYYSQLGVVGKAPRGAIAYKFAAEQATTIVQDIFVSIGRTGSATPVAILKPVMIAGSKVQMATLHNENEVRKKDIRIGDTVIVHKAGDIIPEIIRPLIKLRTGQEKAFIMPKACPDCQTKLVKQKNSDAIWRCPNDNCPSRLWKKIEHFASKEALDISGLGEKNVIALIEAGLVNDAADLYKIKVKDVLTIDRFASKSANKLIDAIKAKKQPSLNKFIYGLGIRHIGVQTAQELAKQFKDLNNLAVASFDELNNIAGIGQIVATAIVEWFSEPKNKLLLDKFKRIGVWPSSFQSSIGRLSGLNFVITGSLKSLTRNEAADKIKSLGGKFQTAVTNETDYLVVGENVGNNKLNKAKELGIKQINETQLLKLL